MVSWTPANDSKLFALVLKQGKFKLDYAALAAAMGEGVTASALKHRFAKIRNSGPTTANGETSAGNDGSSPIADYVPLVVSDATDADTNEDVKKTRKTPVKKETAKPTTTNAVTNDGVEPEKETPRKKKRAIEEVDDDPSDDEHVTNSAFRTAFAEAVEEQKIDNIIKGKKSSISPMAPLPGPVVNPRAPTHFGRKAFGVKTGPELLQQFLESPGDNAEKPEITCRARGSPHIYAPILYEPLEEPPSPSPQPKPQPRKAKKMKLTDGAGDAVDGPLKRNVKGKAVSKRAAANSKRATSKNANAKPAIVKNTRAATKAKAQADYDAMDKTERRILDKGFAVVIQTGKAA